MSGNLGRVLQFKVSLDQIKPKIWRRIQISDRCSFWALHVAIQDAMGWEDCHLHEFILIDPVSYKPVRMGIPFEDDIEEMNPEAGWKFRVLKYMEDNHRFEYIYDFGDNWHHTIEFEGIFDKNPEAKYPICLDGARKCPPEDVGSIYGYYDFVKAMKNKRHPEHKRRSMWIGGSYDPEEFDASAIRFSRSSVRLNRMLDDID
jgi:hypothetical protein